LPRNDLNLQTYTTLGSERIAAFKESLPDDVIINGWIHSHGALMFEHFSPMDQRNHLVVLDFVAAGLRKPVAKREIAIRDLTLLLEDQFVEEIWRGVAFVSLPMRPLPRPQSWKPSTAASATPL